MNITSGKMKTALKCVIYGPEGIGKSTFAAQFPDPVFIDTEGSTKHMDVRRFDKPSSWEMLKQEVEYVIRTPNVCKTLVIDTFDWAEQLCISALCSKHGKSGIEDFGYGNGYVYEKEDVARFLQLLDRVIDAGVNVTLTAHAHTRKFSQPDEVEEYDRYEMKLGKKTGSQISPLLKEWADLLLFANYETYTTVVDPNAKTKKYKAQGGKRVMYTTHHPCWDAKNRFGLPDKLPFNFAEIAHLFEPQVQTAKAVEHADFTEIIDEDEPAQPAPTSDTPETSGSEIPKPLEDLMQQNGVTEEEIRKVVAARGFFPEDTPITNYPEDFIHGWLLTYWQQVVTFINENIRK